MPKRKVLNIPEISEEANQPKKFKFPDRKFGKTKIVSRKFQKDWFESYPWIHYNETHVRAFCHTCVSAYKQGHLQTCENIEPKFLETGYDNWKDALVKKRGFTAHEQSDCHKNR